MEYKVYKMNECDCVASKLSKEETNNWYKKEIDLTSEEQPLEGVRECDLEQEGSYTSIHEFSEEELNNGRKFKKYNDEVYVFISFKEYIDNTDMQEDIYIICSKEC